ncbi:MAG: sulfatase-like hydrolase/transferase, partial [Deltaproteobacteria bacterium]|nr:sulfatase-like hydrolase/transferase [Deltaproteobacteria bacterium]
MQGRRVVGRRGFRMPTATRARGDTRADGRLRRPIGFRRSSTTLLMFLACTIGCRGSTPQGHSERLVDPGHRARMIADFGRGPVPLPGTTSSPASDAGTAGFPRVPIADDTRLVLAAPASGILMLRQHLQVSPTGAVHETVRADEVFAGSSHLLLMPRVQVGAQWTDLDPRIVKLETREGAPHATVDLRLPAATTGHTIQLVVMATAIDWGPQISLRTAPVRIPKDARLELATGVLEPSWHQGPVQFVVEACGDQACTQLYETNMDPARESDRSWRDASVALDAYVGKNVSLVFRSKLSPLTSEQFSLPVWANPTIRVPRKADRSTPNVVLLSVDTLSARHLPTYGYFRDTAPILAKEFERGGTVFDNCVAAATSTPQAHMSMFTGLHPLEHGITAGVEVLDPAILTVTEQVRTAGVATGAVTEDGWLAAGTGFE